MELHCTLVTLSPGHARARQLRRELVIDVAEGAPGAEVAAALGHLGAGRLLTLDGVPLAECLAGEPPLRSGAVIVAGAVAPPSPAPPLVLVVRTGPAAGTVVPLARGVLALGRAGTATAGPRAALPDPELSREHATVEVGDAGVVLRDADSANGTWLEGARVREASLAVGQEFRIGGSVCTLEFAAEPPAVHPEAGSAPPDPLTVTRHSPPSRRAALIATAVLPLLLGVGLAAATGMWMFLAFTAVSAVSLAIPLFEGGAARRAFARALAAAADDDAARRRRHAPDAGVLVRSAASPSPSATPPSPVPDSAVWLRLGTADQPALITVEPAEPGMDVPRLRGAPLVIPAQGRVAVQGGAEPVAGLLRSLVLQTALLPAGRDFGVVLVGGSPELRLAARYLPRVRVLADGAAESPSALEAAMPAAGSAVVVMLPGLAPEAASACSRIAAQRGWAVFGPAEASGSAPDAEIRLGARVSHLVRGDERIPFAPDLVPAQVFAAAARRAAAEPVHHDGAVPASCGLDEIAAAFDAEGMAEAWSRAAADRAVAVPLGLSASGALYLDLVADGPHILIAGTTGSGKSELLRSMVAGAAAACPPDQLSFLFVDFKGGSGLEPLGGLPHCTGLVTDLAEGGMDRALASLRAELRRRERILAGARAADLPDYCARGGTGLPRLAVVIDEFRVLVDEAPGALAELLRIATVGRSLGMHLVMATQRPQGAVSSDIRANVTTTIALRTQSESESSDVLGSSVSARIPVGLPGRAFLRVAGSEPVEFQTASLVVGASRAASPGILVHDAADWLERGVGSHAGHRIRLPAPAEAAVPLVAAAAAAWARRHGGSGPGLRRLLPPPLPERLALSAVPHAGAHAAAPPSADVLLGVVDLPSEQRTAPLVWTPEAHGHLALVGPHGAGGRECLTAIAAQLLAAPPTRHVYVLDADGSLAWLAGQPRVGAHAGASDLRRAARVIARLAEECSARRSGHGGATPLVLLISGWGAWVSALRQSPQAWAEEALVDLVRDGAAAGLAVVAEGEREFVASRAFAGLPSRIHFPLGTTEETRLAWPRLPAMPALAGRGAATGTVVPAGAHAVQCAVLDEEAKSAWTEAGVRAPCSPRPFRVDPLPALAPAHEVAARAREAAGGMHGGNGIGSGDRCADGPLLVGLAGDEAAPLALELGHGQVLLVLGGRGAGKSGFLEALPLMNSGTRFVHPPRAGQLEAWEDLLAGAEAGRRPLPAVVLVDDADSLTPAEDALIPRILDAGARVVATAAYSAALYARCPLALTARSSGVGLLLAPRSPADGEVFGTRIDVPGRVPPGRAIAVVDGCTVDVQLGHRAPRAGRMPGAGSGGPLTTAQGLALRGEQ
ncbi:FtsK/SpoIIIE domain-containing protein [Sinomonas halotolerans]|uniref:FtsK/SpoIIIE domain-containing protein n=1 Tax=Sinomonas halotolerans TaxID=1644133 RepID=A0ABU9WWH1_9MICC